MNVINNCRTIIIAGLATACASAAYATPPIQAMTLECNWGKLTMEAIRELDFEQGKHSSDPSGDGHGPGTNDEPRVGLANVIEQGNLEYTCDLIEDLLGL